MTYCIGCGYCCRKAPCWLGDITKNGKWCDFLYYSYKQKKWRCKLMTRKSVRTNLAAGLGCSSALNTLRRTCTIPTPKQLKEGEFK
jgi:hypothetical protein